MSGTYAGHSDASNIARRLSVSASVWLFRVKHHPLDLGPLRGLALGAGGASPGGGDAITALWSITVPPSRQAFYM